MDRIHLLPITRFTRFNNVVVLINREREIDFHGCDETLIKVLMDLGFEYRKKNRTRALIETEGIVLKRINFLKKYVENMRANPEERLEELFEDET